MIEIHNLVFVALRSVIMCHGKGVGKVIIKEKARVGPGAMVIATGGRSITIGEGAVIDGHELGNGKIGIAPGRTCHEKQDKTDDEGRGPESEPN